MSSLQRYKKQGGFSQLVSLIETFGPQKKEKFLEMIESESAPWAVALREKMITIERMFTWPDQMVIEVFKRLPVKSFAYAMESFRPEQRARLEVLMSSAEKRRLAESLEGSKPKPDEIASVWVKAIEVARRMVTEKEIQAHLHDDLLVIPNDIESLLEQRGSPWSVDAKTRRAQAKTQVEAGLASASPAPEPIVSTSAPSAETEHLRRTLGTTLKENQTLKEEVRILRDKLDQIRKIA